MQRAMAAEAESTRDARAKVVIININNIIFFIVINISSFIPLFILITLRVIINNIIIAIKVIASEGEQKAAKALKEAADVISQSPAALQLR